MSIDASLIGYEAAKMAIARSRHARVEGQALTAWQVDPVGWVETRLHGTLWSRQRQIAESVRDNRRTAVKASYNIGKSAVAARLACWWIDSHQPGEAFVLTTATSGSQVRAILWREINRAHAAGRLMGHTNQTEWWIGSEMVAMGRKPADYDEEAFAGVHARYVLVIVDEASGVPAALWTAAEGLISNEGSRILAIGNPIDGASRFADVCKPGSGWNVITIGADDSPNFTGEQVPEVIAASLVSRTWVEERRGDWTEASPMWSTFVRGEFPEESSDGVVLQSWAKACQREPDSDAQAEQWGKEEPNELGVDVGAGGDETVIYHRRGARASMLWHGQTPDWPQATGHVVDAIRQTGARRVKVDVIGIGWGVVGRLEELREQGAHACEVVGVNVADAPRDPSRFVKLRDEIWWTVGRDLSRALAWDLRGVDDATVGQLIAPKYAQDSAGRIKVERKEETRRRIGRSPDRADALLLAFFEPDFIGPGVTDYLYGIWNCTNPRCGRGFVWQAERPCPFCGTRAPTEYPKPPGMP